MGASTEDRARRLMIRIETQLPDSGYALLTDVPCSVYVNGASQ